MEADLVLYEIVPVTTFDTTRLANWSAQPKIIAAKNLGKVARPTGLEPETF